jgi:DSF synthase
MDRLSGDLGRGVEDGELFDPSNVSLITNENFLLRRSEDRLAIPDRLFALNELDVHYDSDQRALWTFMRPKARPSFTPHMLAEFELWQSLIAQGFGPGQTRLDFLILGSRSPGVFCFGGDLQLFEILDRNLRALDLPLLTIGLVQGQALGGGFEALLSFDFIIAERGSTFGLPETMFGLFPGMGAHPLLSRKLGTAMAERLILSDDSYSAESMYELGIVHALAEPGEGVAAVREFMSKSARRHAGIVAARKAMRVSSPVPMAEFYSIVEIWADAAMQLSEKDLKLMLRLVSAQNRLAKAS